MKTKKQKILIIIGGGISAYKSLDLIRILKKNNYEIKTVLTKSGKEFVTPLSLTSLSNSKNYEDIFDAKNESEIDHISLSRWADLIIVIPTTANFMSKLSSGRAEDLATTIILASNKDILLAPAMNVRMWTHKATQTNYKTLIGYGYKFIGPINGEMACGEYGEGKMSSPRQIFSEIKKYFNYRRVVKQKKISAVVTTGPTREYLDPVRYISNESSGQQGYEIAVALSRAGVKTTLIAGACTLSPTTDLKIINVTTANEMFNKVKQLLPTDIAICVAAVSDFKPKLKNKNKIKKDNNEFKSIAVEKNPDILEFLGKNNKHRPSLVIGFAAETEDVIKNSLNKLKNKNCDMIIANDVTKNDTGFNSNFNEVFLIDAKGVSEKITKNKKSYIASVLTKKILNKFLINDKNLN
jgi:phosphopantothenoylcysteine decarboxylase / phosphopantothenate---cysteine ligase